MEGYLEAHPPDPPADLAEDLRRFYKGRHFEPAWAGSDDGRAKARELLRILAGAEREGLEPTDYGVSDLEDRLQDLELAGEAGGRGEEARLGFEVALSRAFLHYARDLSRGRLDPSDFSLVHREPEGADHGEALAAAVAPQGSVEEELARLAPRHPNYEALREALARERRLRRDGADLAVAELPDLRPGDRADPGDLALLAERLQRSGHLDGLAPAARGAEAQDGSAPERTAGAPGEAPISYDGDLVAAVERFQENRDLEADGIVGPRTREAMARTADDRIARILVNMERWRWLDAPLREPHVRVNLAAQELVLARPDRPPLRMRVVVGERDWATPIFSDRIEAVVANPYWNVPESIAREELLPELLEEPERLEAKHLEFVRGWGDELERLHVDREAVEEALAADEPLPWRLRQKPFPGNALGRLKFLMPNRHAIYLHDTPADSLFQEEDRAFSHGCIRLAHPFELAEALLGEESGWTAARLRDATQDGERQRIDLPRPVPVHLVYWTVEPNEDGVLRIHEDLYGLDARMGEALRDGRGTASADGA